MTFNQVLKTVGSDYEVSARFAHEIVSYLVGAEYESISKRGDTTAPSVFLGYGGKRFLSFDLRRTRLLRVYFWVQRLITQSTRDKHNMKLEKGTGWLSLTIGGDAMDELADVLLTITRYWRQCQELAERGDLDSDYRRQQSILCLVQESFPEHIIISDKRCIPNLKGRPDIYVPELKLVIEVDGLQHFKRVEYFQKTQADFEAQVQRDRAKDKIYLLNGLTVLRIVVDAVDLISEVEMFRDILQSVRAKGGINYYVRVGQAGQLLEAQDFWRNYAPTL